jgi:hypothetical protein
MRIDTQVILVSGQPTPNITPALDPEVGPREIVMLVSPDMRQRADWLAEVLQPRGIRVERRDLADAYDVEDIRNRVLEVIAERSHETVALNVTGGTKLMAIAAYEVFFTAGMPIFYVHPERDRLIWMHPPGLPHRDLADRIKLDAFLKAHGADLAERPAHYGMAESRKRLAEGLVAKVDRYQSALSTLNWAAMKAEAEGSLVSPAISAQLRRDGLRELLDWFEAEGLISVNRGRLHFADEAARFFANGGWLEQYVYATVQALKRDDSAIQDIGRGLEVSRPAADRGRIINELDVAFLAQNRLHVVECKTRKFNDETENGGAGAEAVYKLDALANLLGGLQAKAMLVSYQPLKPSILNRARDYRILTCACGELGNLRGRLQQWLP